MPFFHKNIPAKHVHPRIFSEKSPLFGVNQKYFVTFAVVYKK